ncbi:hypothetical protein D3C77_622570 [compost metagenome]
MTRILNPFKAVLYAVLHKRLKCELKQLIVHHFHRDINGVVKQIIEPDFLNF